MTELYKKHREAITEGCEFIDGQVRGLLIQDAIDRAVKISTEFATEQLSKAKEASCILSRNDLVEWFDKKISELKSEL